ncbi:MAG: diaminopimelate decarboxylase [Thermodesulfobacteriota bacterium]
MHFFQYKKTRLYAEAVPVETIANQVGTPCYIYSQSTLERHFKAFDQAFSKTPHLICYSQKANSNLALLSLFGSLGGGTDIVSGGELFRALKAGIPPQRIVYSGVGKTPEEIRYALKEKILLLNIESPEELKLVNDIAGRMKRKAPIGIRINPDIDPKTHPYVSTGLKKNKFGIGIHQSLEEYRLARELPHIQIEGIDFHLGSQLLEIDPFCEAIQKIKKLIVQLQNLDIEVRYLDLGGGLGITYSEEGPPHPKAYAQAVLKELGRIPYTLILEPGRVLVGNAGILVTKVLYLKKGEEKNFIIVDAGMNDLLRPSLYGSYHHIQPVVRRPLAPIRADVVGPICESGDFLGKDRSLPLPRSGELLAVMSAGAYGFSMSSNYNSRPRVAEVLVNGNRFEIVRSRETYRQLTALERIPKF